MSRKQKVLEIPLSQVDTDPVGDMLAASDAVEPYLDHDCAVMSGTNPEKTLAVIAALPLEKRYLSRIMQRMAWALVDFDSKAVKLDIPYIKDVDGLRAELQTRLWQLEELIEILG